jgi:hypothetical protein
MGRDARLLAGPGFAVFTTRPSFAVAVVDRYLTLDPAVRDVVLIHHASSATSPPLCAPADLANLVTARGARIHLAPWERYGEPERVRAIADLPSEGLAFVSLDHRKTLGDRLDPRRSYVRRKRALKKIVIDTLPYEVTPWRSYFPFAFCNRDLLGYHHSYALEQDYERFLDGGLPENPCDAHRLADMTWPAAVVDAPAYFTARPEVRLLQATPEDVAAYAAHRDHLFATEKSIASVKAKLSAWIQDRYPERSIPVDLRRVYKPGFADAPLVHTDLPFDRWLAGEITGLMDHTDRMLARYVERQREAGEPEGTP